MTGGNGLKAGTKYVCPVGYGRLGHSGIYTGANNPVFQRPSDGFCICGERMVEEVDDGSRWRLTWEMDTGSGWHPVEKETASERDARSQADGLRELAAQGEKIRDVRLARAMVAWEPVDLGDITPTGLHHAGGRS